MKRCVFVVAMALFIPVLCYAQEQGNMTRQDTAGQSMMSPSMGKCKCPCMQQAGRECMGGMSSMGGVDDRMKCMKQCRQMMAGTGIMPADKGGVIVLYAGYLYKYDKDLKLVNKVALEGE